MRLEFDGEQARSVENTQWKVILFRAVKLYSLQYTSVTRRIL